MQAPPPSVPFVEYVLKAIEHPPFMFVSKLAACCTILFLTRSDPELLRALCFKWAVRFQMDRKKLIAIIRRRSKVCKDVDEDENECLSSQNSRDPSESGSEGEGRRVAELASSNGNAGGRRQHNCHDDDSANDDDEDRDVDDDGNGVCAGGLRLCNPDEAVEHFLKILNSLVPMYFSWNWHRTDYVIQVNKEYESYVRENIMPICVATSAEDGVDDEEETPWLLSPNEYLTGSSPNLGNFYSPVTRREPAAHSSQPPQPHHHEPQKSAALKPIRTDFEHSPTDHFGGAVLHSPKFASDDTDGARSTPDHEPDGFSAASDYERGAVDSRRSRQDDAAGLSFVTLANFHEALEANTNGLVIVFHAKYSAKSNEVLEAFQQIVRKKLLNPMPDVAVVYTVAEPELATLYNVSWFPTVIYTPPAAAEPHNPIPALEAELHDAITTIDEAIHASVSLSSATPYADSHAAAGNAGLSPHPRRTETVQGPAAPGSSGKRLAMPRSPFGSTEEMGNSTSSGVPTAVGRGGTARNTVSSLSPRSGTATTTTTKAFTTTSTMKQGGHPSSLGVASAVPASLPSCPSPTKVLYGFSVEKERPCPSPLGMKLSPTNRNGQLQQLQPAYRSPLSGSTSLLPALSLEAAGPGKNHVDPMFIAASLRSDSNVNASESSLMLTDAAVPPPQGQSNPLGHSESSSTLSMLVDSNGFSSAQDLQARIASDGHKVFPMNGVVSVASLVDWVASKGQAPPKIKKIKDFVTRVSALRAEQKYKKYRELHSAVVMLRRLQSAGLKDGCQACDVNSGSPNSGSPRRLCGRVSGNSTAAESSGTTTTVPPLASSPSCSSEPPLFIFLGGGMAAGKSTAAMALAHSAWWRSHKDQSVLVNADEFKVNEPDFDDLQAEVHTKSTRAAETLLVQAVNQGRSIVFDGTMMWAPFVLQVIQMVRDAHLTLYKNGPGYRGPGKPEEYFVPSEVRPTPLPKPYGIRFLGITVEPEIAVPRGFLRKFSTGRGVPITTQLRSFKMFAENFPLYARMVDSATLYNNNVFVDLDKGELPPIMAESDAERTGGILKVYDEAAYQLFMKQKTLNEDADNILELYPAQSPTSGLLQAA